MTLEDMLDEYEADFKNFLDELASAVEEKGSSDDILEMVETQNELLELLYDAVTYAHQSDYPSHFSSEIKKVDKIISNYEDDT